MGLGEFRDVSGVDVRNGQKLHIGVRNINLIIRSIFHVRLIEVCQVEDCVFGGRIEEMGDKWKCLTGLTECHREF